MAKIFAHCRTTACSANTIAAEAAAEATTQAGASPVGQGAGGDQFAPVSDPLDRFRSHGDLPELGRVLYFEHASLDLTCPDLQELIVQVKGTFHGALLHERAFPIPKPKKERFRGPKRRRSAHAGPLPSLFDEGTT